MIKVIIRIILLLIFVSFIPMYCCAENSNVDTQNLSTKVTVISPAQIIFQNNDKIIKQEIEVGKKLKEPSYLEIDGYVFDGWYDGEHKWDFENDIVTGHLTLVAKYIPIENYIINIKVDEKSIMQPSILNEADLKAEFVDIGHNNNNNNNNNVNAVLEIKNAENTITESEKSIFKKEFEQKKLSLGKYIDLSLLMELNQDPTTKKEIYETRNKIKIQITIPKDMRFNNKKYYILSLYDGTVETIYEGFPSKDWKITFETDKFSLYAIAYSNDNYINPNNPTTGDNISLWVWLMSCSLIGIIITLVYAKKKLAKNSIKLLEGR